MGNSLRARNIVEGSNGISKIKKNDMLIDNVQLYLESRYMT